MSIKFEVKNSLSRLMTCSGCKHGAVIEDGKAVCNLSKQEILFFEREATCPANIWPMSPPATSTPEVASASQPSGRWPLWARAVERLRLQEDIGVGDTIHRSLGSAGESFKLTMKTLGVPCGCDRRRDEWNRLYSYEGRDAD